MKKGTPKQYPIKKAILPKKQVNRNKYGDLGWLAIIILLGFIIYSNSFTCSFHFDDLNNIVNNSKIRDLSDIKAWWNYVPSRPVGTFTFALNYHFNQLDVRYWHFVNLIIHLINACLVWWLTILIFSSPAMKDQPIIRHNNLIAFFTALLFVSHPLATQSVTYIVQRLASLVAIFYLLSLTLYIKARLSDKGNTLKYFLFAGSLISAVLAMLTKENAFTLPFAILLIELFFFRIKKLSINFKDYRVLVLIAVFLGIMIILPLKFSFSIFQTIGPQQGQTFTLTPFTYFLTQFSVIVKYIQLLFIPINQMVDYDFPISYNFFNIRTFLSFLVLLSLLILAIFLYRKQRIISFGIFWFFLTLSVESSIIPIPNVIFEHRTYLPSFGFFLVLSTVICGLAGSRYKVRESVIMVIMVIMVILNSYLTFERNKVWKDELTLWSDNIAKAPDKARPYLNRSMAYEKLGQWENEIADCSRAISINPKFANGYYNRGVAYGKLRQLDNAIADYSKAVELDTTCTNGYYNRAIIYEDIGQWTKAIEDCSKAIILEPKFSKSYSNRSIAYGKLGQWDKMIADCSKAIEIDPKFGEAYNNRGFAYGNSGKLNNAIADYSMAIGFDPDIALTYFNRGATYGKLGQLDKAIADYSSAVRINPNYANAYFNRGIAYGELGQWEKAIADYSRVIELEPKNTNAYINREIAYKRLGNVKR